MSVKSPEDFNNNGDSLVDANGSYEESYDDIDSSEQVSDEWEDDDDDLSDTEDEEPQDSSKKKKSKSSLFIILGVVLLAILGFVFLAGGEDESVNQQEVVAEDPVPMSPDVANSNDIQQQEQPVIIADAQVTPEPKPEPVVEQTGILDDQDVVNRVENSISENPMAEPPQVQLSAQAPSEQDIKVSNDNSAVTEQNGNDVVSVATPDIKSVSDFPTIDSIKKADVAEGVTPTNIPDIKETSPVSVAETGIDKSIFEEKLKTAEARIADLEKMLSDKEIELNEQKSALSIKSNNEEVETLKAKITELENKLSNDSQSTETEALTQSNIKKSDKIAEPINPEPINPSATQPELSISNQPVKQAPIWILRSANSTKAVIYNKVSGDLKSVAVGDTVEGLGRIQSISEQNSLWVIKASKSSLSE